MEIIPAEIQVQIGRSYKTIGQGEGNLNDFGVEEMSVAGAVRVFRKGIKMEAGKGLYASPRVSAGATKFTELLRLLVEEANDFGVLGLPLSDRLIVRDQGDTNDLINVDGPVKTGQSGIGMMDMLITLIKLPKFAQASIEGVIDQEGLVYYDTDNDKIRFRTASAWEEVTSA